MSATDPLLPVLEVAVALRIAELVELPPSQRERIARVWAANAGEVLPYSGDALLYRTRYWPARGDKVEAPGTAGVFNHVARGLAALAMLPCGVLFAGVHWCVEHPTGLRCADIRELSCGASGLAATASRRAVTTVQLPGVCADA